MDKEACPTVKNKWFQRQIFTNPQQHHSSEKAQEAVSWIDEKEGKSEID